MITPSYSLTVTKRVLPNLALDFTTASSNASATVTNNVGSVPSITRLALGSRVGMDNFINGYLVKVSYWPQRLTNNEVQAITK